MRAYCRDLETREQVSEEQLAEMPKISSQDRKLFQDLSKEGVKPIEPKELEHLLVPTIQNLLEIYPELKPEITSPGT